MFLKRSVFVVIALGIMIFLVFKYTFREGPEDLSKAKVEYVISANELYKAFRENENDATERYGGEVLKVNGELLSVKADEWGQYILTFVDPLFGVSATIDSLVSSRQFVKIKKLKTGSKVIFIGRCDGMLMDVKLSKCFLLED